MNNLVKLGKQVFRKIPTAGRYIGTALLVCEISILLLRFIDSCIEDPVEDDENDEEEEDHDDDGGDENGDDENGDDNGGGITVDKVKAKKVSSKKKGKKKGKKIKHFKIEEDEDEGKVSSRLFEDNEEDEKESSVCYDGWLPHELS